MLSCDSSHKLCIDQRWVYWTKVYWLCASNILASSPWTRYCNERPWDSSSTTPCMFTLHHCACDKISQALFLHLWAIKIWTVVKAWEQSWELQANNFYYNYTHIPRLSLHLKKKVANQGLEQGEPLRWHFSPPYLVMWTFYAKQVVLQIAPTLCQLQELLVINYGAVKVRHNCAGEICSSCR